MEWQIYMLLIAGKMLLLAKYIYCLQTELM